VQFSSARSRRRRCWSVWRRAAPGDEAYSVLAGVTAFARTPVLPQKISLGPQPTNCDI
jgi:hypothetical protein